MLLRMMSRKKRPRGRVFSAVVLPRRIHLDRIVPEIRQAERLAQQPAVGVGIGAHAPGAFGREGLEFGD